MAIFAGNWKDAFGIPFDPDAKVLQAWPGGGMAAGRRRKISPHPAHAAFSRNGRATGHDWLHVLTPTHRTDWQTAADTGVTRRGSVSRIPAAGYIAFSSIGWVDRYDHESTDRYAVAPLIITFTGGTLEAVDLVAQTLTYDVTWAGEAADPQNAAIAVYQVNPRYVRSPNPHRQTRLIDLHEIPSSPPWHHTATVDLAWPAAAGDAVRIYIRGRAPDYYQWETLQSRSTT